MAKNLFGTFPGADGPMSMIEYLDLSSFDELAEFDLLNDRHRNIYHIEGKYFVPALDCGLQEMLTFAGDTMVHPEDRLIYQNLMEPGTLEKRLAEAENPGILHAQLRYKLLNGGWRWTEQIVVGGSLHGLPAGIVRVYIFDIQNQKDRQAGLKSTFSAEKQWNERTGLLNQQAFFQSCEARIPECEGWILLCIDIENFKLFNDWYGREAGNLLLARIGSLLREAAGRCEGLAGYLGQDDFCMFAPDKAGGAGRLYRSIHELIVDKGTSVGFLPAIGIARVTASSSVLDLYDQAALAARNVRGDFHNRIKHYDPSMRETTVEEYRILSDFQKALANNEIFFCLQPQCRISTGRVIGAESLARWRRADGRMMPPDHFVPILEKYGFVTDLDQFIWKAVCQWLADWIARGNTPLPISVNVSQVDIFTIDVPEYIESLTREYHLPRDVLKIEITESAYVSDTAKVRDTVRQIREMGYVVLMDDFGSGYSSLNMLRILNVDIIKLDAQFLRLSDRDEDKGIHIIETIVNMAQTMALPIIVEGVENEEQVSFLTDLGCRYIQGYHYFRPMEVADFEKLIADARNVDMGGFSFKANRQFEIREFMDQNIYSDAMLNNILGPVAFYEWDGGEDVQIVRFNEQFYHIVREPVLFHNRLEHIQDYFHPNDRKPFLDALRRAKEDHLNGAFGIFGTYRADGSLVRFLIHLYFLQETENGQLFYGAVRDLTEYTTLQNQMKLLSRFASESIVFVRKIQSEFVFQVVVHGLREYMDLSAEDFERELNEDLFARRFAEDEQQKLRAMTTGEILKHADRFRAPYHMTCGHGETKVVAIKVDQVCDEYSNVEYILSFRAGSEAGVG